MAVAYSNKKIIGRRWMKKLPLALKKYFWDAEFEKIGLEKSRTYILKRILEYGDEYAVRWMRKNFKKEEIKNALCNLRFSPKTANFWAFALNVKKEDVKCLSRSFRETQKQFWAH